MPDEYNATPVQESKKKFKEFRECREEEDYRKSVKTNLPYFTGEDQGWDEFGDRAKKQEEDRPALTMNRIRGIMRLICGVRPKSETSFLPNEDGDVETADILNACDDHIDRVNMWKFHEEEWFKLGTLLSRRVVEIKKDYSKDIMGGIKLQLHDGNKFYLDPNAKEKDRSDSDDMFMVEYIDKKQVKQMFPKHAAEIEGLSASQEGVSDDSSSTGHDSGEPDEYNDPKANYYDSTSKKLCIVYHWYKERYTTTKILNLMTGEVLNGKKSYQDTQDEFEKDNMTEFFKAVPVDFIDVKNRVFCHDIELETGATPWNRDDGMPTKLSNSFPFVIYEPERIIAGNQTKLTNLIDDLKDPQKYFNVLTSLVLEIIGTQASSGLDYEEGAASPEWEGKLKKYGAKPGFNMKWNKGAISENRVKPRNPGAAPQTQMMAAKQMGDEILNDSGVQALVSSDSLGKGASGIAVDLKQRQGGNIISWLYESFRFFQHQLADFKRDAIQCTFTYEKVVRARGKKNKPIRINEKTYDEYGAIQEVLNNPTIGTFDTTVTDKEIMPTQRVERFKFFTELAKSGALQIPPPVMNKIFIALMDDPHLGDLIEKEMDEFEQQQTATLQGGGGGEQGMPQQAGMMQ